MKIEKIHEIAGEEKEVFSFFDEGFPDRVLKTSFLLSLLIIAYSLSSMSFMVTLSVSIGCFTSLVLCKVLWWTIQHALKYKKSDIKQFFLKVSIIKYSLVGVLLLSVCLFLEVHAIAMALGFSVVVAVIVMKIGSKLLVNYMNKSVKVS